MELSALQREFMDHVVREPTQQGIVEAPASLQELLTDSNPNGLAIYRNAYTARLIGVLESDHEKLFKLMGSELFAVIARQFIERHPSQVRSLRQFGDPLPGFIRGLDIPNGGLLAELCAFERTLLDVYDAPDARPIGFEQIGQIAPVQWPSLALDFHPSLRLFRAPEGAVGCWQQLHAGREFDATSSTGSPDAVWRLWRNPARVSQFQLVEAAEQAALEGFQMDGATLAGVADALIEQVGADVLVSSLNQWLRDWCAQGLVIGVAVTDGISPHPQ